MKTTKITAAFSVALLSALTLFTPLSNATEDSSNNQSPTALQPCIASIPEAQTLNLEEAGSNFSRELLPNASTVQSTSWKQIGFVREGEPVVGNPGTTISITRKKGTTFSVGVSASASAEAGVVFAKASASAGINFTYSWTSTHEESGSWTVPNNGRRGWIAIGNDKYAITARILYSGSKCSPIVKTKTYQAISRATSFTTGQF